MTRLANHPDTPAMRGPLDCLSRYRFPEQALADIETKLRAGGLMPDEKVLLLQQCDELREIIEWRER